MSGRRVRRRRGGGEGEGKEGEWRIKVESRRMLSDGLYIDCQ